MSTTTQELSETLAEVLALIPRYSWEIMDEEQKDELMEKVVLPRWNARTSDGTKLTQSVWAKVLGASVDSVRSRVFRLKQSEIPAEEIRANSLSDNEKAGLRSAKSTLMRKPDAAAKLAASLDPVTRMELAEALAAATTETTDPSTMGGAVQAPEVQIKQAVTRSKHDRMKDITEGIRAISAMDVEEFVRHHNWEYDSDHAPSLRTVGRELDSALDKLQKLRDLITARLLEVNG